MLSAVRDVVDHTATVNVLDREGQTMLMWPFGTDGDAMDAGLAHLLKEGSSLMATVSAFG